MRRIRQWGALVAFAALALVTIDADPATAIVIDVPDDFLTLQAAVAAAAGSGDVNNVITISNSPVLTSSTVSIGAAFGPTRQLVIRPAPNLTRASIVNDDPLAVIIQMTTAKYDTLEDLDILRNITNGNSIVVITECEEILVQRCRIGSNWSTTGTGGWSNVVMQYPTRVMLKNNIMFANAMGTFDYGINVEVMADPDNSIRLYNNDVSDYNEYGIRVSAGEGLVLLRNNVVVNHEDLITEPFAYRTEVQNNATVVTSHNVAFADPLKVQSVAGQDIAGTGSSFLNFTKADAPASFVTVDWNMVFDANPDHYRLVDLGPLHDGPADYGMTVTNVFPDFEVVDDIEEEYRPGGVDLHTDRGADQLDPGTEPVAVLINSFDATPRGSVVDVTWDLWSDEALDRFTLYRRNGPAPFVIVASGESETTRKYTDTTVEPGETYHYELVIRTAIGSEFRSPVATVTVGRWATALSQNFPNPFNPQTTIEYTVSEKAMVSIDVFDASGKSVLRLYHGERGPGTYRTVWDGRDGAGKALASGVYFVRLTAGARTLTRKAVLMK
jgi:hypothetical protein